MKKRYYIVTLLLLMGTSPLFAQDNSTKKADKYYARLEYVKAAEKYQDLVDDGDGTAYIYKRLADTYANLNNTQGAETYYGKYLETDPGADVEYYYKYAQTLKGNGKYDESNAAMDQFASQAPTDDRAKAYLANRDYLPELLNAAPHYTVEPSAFNAELSDFGGYEHDEKLYFVSARNKSRRDYGWNDQPTLDIYVASKVDDTYKDAKLLKGDVNSKFNEGTVSITNDGNTMYFTRNDYLDGDYEKDSEGIGQLKIYSAKLVNGEWDDIQSLPFNNSEYSTGHTALSPDGKTMYFSSDMPGGSGESDLYKVSLDEEGNFGEPQNLGPAINTPGRESFPYVDSEGTLYFSSDGHLGIGGLDVFYVKASGSSFGEVGNIGQPINSQNDDFAFTYNPTEKQGYVSSNRGEAADNDNIYKVKAIEIKELDILVTVINSENGAPISGATVLVYDADENQVAAGQTAKDGTVDFMDLEGEMTYMLQANAKEYESNDAVVDKEEGEVAVTIELDPIKKIIKEEEVVLNPIMFDFDKANIRPDAALELDRLIAVMKKHPGMEIKVEGYTDNRGSASYNKGLSARRAQSTVEYIISQGVDSDRLSSEGFGEENPKVDCGGKCTEKEHQKNRRSVFRIIKK